MADVKISALPAAGALDGTENPPVVQGGVTKKMTLSQLLAYLNGLALLHLGNNLVSISNTGAIAGNFWNIQADGSASFSGGGLLTIAADGTLNINAAAVMLLPTGAATFANGGAGINNLGQATFFSIVEVTNSGSSVILASPNGSRWAITVDDAGQLSTAPA